MHDPKPVIQTVEQAVLSDVSSFLGQLNEKAPIVAVRKMETRVRYEELARSLAAEQPEVVSIDCETNMELIMNSGRDPKIAELYDWSAARLAWGPGSTIREVWDTRGLFMLDVTLTRRATL